MTDVPVSQAAREAEVTQDDIGWATSAAQHLCSSQDRDAAIRLLAQAFARHRQQAERDVITRMEPVAWLNETEDDRWLSFDREDPDAISCDFTATPLYALPTPPEAA